jgi:hypothetical protein
MSTCTICDEFDRWIKRITYPCMLSLEEVIQLHEFLEARRSDHVDAVVEANEYD